MQQDDAAETKRHDESARTPVAAKKGVTAKKVLEHIDPERLSKAIRYLKEHPKFVRPRREGSQAQTLRRSIPPLSACGQETAPAGSPTCHHGRHEQKFGLR
jgi:hypothetical protein